MSGIKLVLEGGGARAAYSAGVVDGLARAGIVPRVVIGCSSGSINAAFVASRQTETVCKLWGEYVPGKQFINFSRLVNPWAGPALAVDAMLDEVMIGQGLFDRHAATEGPIDLYVAATDIDSGRGHLVRPTADTVIEWLRASLALPVGYNRIVEVEGGRYVDGGVAMPVPFDEPIDTEVTGPTVVVLTRKMDTLKAAPLWWQKAFIRSFVPRSARGATLVQHELHNEVMKRLQVAVDKGEVILINPPDNMPLSRFSRDADQLRAGIEMGREVGQRSAEKLGAGSTH